jgi:hypothetical protein
MTMNQVEELLRKAPSPKAPEGLLRKLTADIRLPRAAALPVSDWSRPPSWTRRWLPALSFAAIFLVCLAVIAVQTNILSELQRQNGRLRAGTQNLDVLRTENADYQKLATENLELDRMRKDNAELLKLRREVVQLQSLTEDAGKVRAEHAQLLASAKQSGVAGAGSDFFADEKAKAERIHCVNNLKQIGLAARIWAQDNENVYPTNFICMTNELSTWKILQCTSDKTHSVTNWAEVEAGNISYIMDAPGMLASGPGYDPHVIFVECPIHHSVCLMDGSVQMLSDIGYGKIKVVDGRKVLP